MLPRRCLHVTNGAEPLFCSCSIKLITNCTPSPGKIIPSETLIKCENSKDKTRRMQNICSGHNFRHPWSRGSSHSPLPVCSSCLPETTRGTCVLLLPPHGDNSLTRLPVMCQLINYCKNCVSEKQARWLLKMVRESCLLALATLSITCWKTNQ